MLRVALCVLLGLAATAAHAENIVPLEIGGAEVKVAVDDNLLQLSTKEPFMFEKTSAALPPVLHFIEGFVTEDDVKRAVSGSPLVGPFYQIHIMRPLEPLTFSAAEWTRMMPAIKKSLGMTTISKKEAAELDKRASDAFGVKMKMDVKPGTPVVYSEDNGVLRFTMVVPTKIQSSAYNVDITLDCGGALVRLHGKAVYLLVYAQHREDKDIKDGSAVIPLVDAFVNRALELNDPATPSGPAVATTTPARDAQAVATAR